VKVNGTTITDAAIAQLEAEGAIDRDLSRLARNATGRNSSPSINAARRVCASTWNARHAGVSS
jgi:hypothetical protein